MFYPDYLGGGFSATFVNLTINGDLDFGDASVQSLTLGDDDQLIFGDGNDATLVFDTTDANANMLKLGLPAGTATEVPTLLIGIDTALVGIDNAFSNGTTDPRIAIVSPDGTDFLIATATNTGVGIDSNVAMAIGGTTSTGLTLGRAGTNVNVAATFNMQGSASTNAGSMTQQGQFILDGDNAEMFLVRKNGDTQDVFTIDTSAGGVIREVTAMTDAASALASHIITNSVVTTGNNANSHSIFNFSNTYSGTHQLTNTLGGLRGFISNVYNSGSGIVDTQFGRVIAMGALSTATSTLVNGDYIIYEVAAGATMTEFNGSFYANNLGAGSAGEVNALGFESDYISNSYTFNVNNAGTQNFVPMSTANTGITWDSQDLTLATTTSGNIILDPVDGEVLINNKLTHSGDTNTHIAYTSDNIILTAGGEAMLNLLEDVTQSVVSVNSGGLDIDFRVEDDGGSNIIATDAALSQLSFTPSALATGLPLGFKYTDPAHTNMTTTGSYTAVQFDLSSTKTWATGAVQGNAFFAVNAPTVAFAGASTLSSTGTFYVDRGPNAGSNATVTNSVAIAVGNVTGSVAIDAESVANYASVQNDIASGRAGMTTLTDFLVFAPPTGNISLGDTAGTVINLNHFRFEQQTYDAGDAVAVTNPATIYIEGPMVASTNVTFTNPALSLHVDAGSVRFDEGQFAGVTTVNAATYDLLISDYILNVTYTGTGAVTSLTLPTAQTTAGRVIQIKDAGGNAGTNNITVDTEGSETIDGAATYVLNADYESTSLYSDGSDWFIF